MINCGAGSLESLFDFCCLMDRTQIQEHAICNMTKHRGFFRSRMSNGLNTTSVLDNQVLTKLVAAILDASMQTDDIKSTDRKVLVMKRHLRLARVLRGK